MLSIKTLVYTASVLAALCVSSSIHGQVDQDAHRILLMPLQETSMKAKLPGTIASVNKRMGDPIEEDELLLTYNDTTYRAELEKAIAELERAEWALKSREELARREIGTPYEVQEAKAAVAAARAAYITANKNLEDTSVKAPYKGRVSEKMVDVAEFTRPGDDLFELIEDHILIGRLLIPSSHLVEIAIGAPVKVFIEDVQRSTKGTVRGVGARVDPTSSMIQVEVEIDNADRQLLSGMTGWAVIATENNAEEV